MAVELRGVHKSYKRLLRKPIPVLHNVNLHVPAGQIFGLLGPSGCGKTTLLRCIVSRIAPDDGTVTVLGKPLGTPGLGVPGHNVGYMPQELALVLELTIVETLWYFGRLAGMGSDKLKDRIDFLIGLLGLPKETRAMSDLSGGQQRRVSFASALLHEPRLLILDEPTVGVDPLLRVSIWDHLLNVAQYTGTTIIITTHYIEEARRAHTVGLMRQGRLLVQSSPNALLQAYNTTSLEEVFLQLCREDRETQLSSSNTENIAPESVAVTNNSIYEDPLLLPANGKLDSPKKYCNSFNDVKPNILKRLNRIHALMYRNYMVMLRNAGGALLEILVPSICVILVVIAIGQPYRGMEIGVANSDEFPFGKLYLKQLDSQAFIQKTYENNELALESVRKRDAWAALNINYNFTQATAKRYTDGASASNQTIFDSQITVRMDTTDFHVAYAIQKELYLSYVDFAIDLVKEYELNPAIAESAVIFEKPIYGDANPTYVNNVIPGMIVQLTFCFAALLTSLACVSEYTDGLLDRTWVSGITRADVTISHLVVQGSLALLQIIIAVMTTFFICGMDSEGSVALVIFMLLLVGFCGNSLGLVISTIAPNDSAAILIQVVWFFSTTFMFGCLWPLEAMPRWLMYISYVIPQTMPAEAIKSVMLRGWTMGYLQVWLSCLTTIIWNVVYIALAGFIMHLRR